MYLLNFFFLFYISVIYQTKQANANERRQENKHDRKVNAYYIFHK